MANPNLQPGLVPYDLTRGGSMFFFHGKANINQYGFFVEDSIKAGNFTINVGLREDQYNGLASANGVQPRLAVAYLIPKTNTVLRAAYARTFETPFNENLILSSGTGPGGLAQNVFGSTVDAHRARLPESIQYRIPAGNQGLADCGCRLFLEVYAQRL